MVRLLLIEDHALVREGLVQTLHQLDTEVEVFAVADSRGAWDLIENERSFDLILLDLGLPGEDGFSCLRTFSERCPSIPVVILSAYDDAQSIERAMKNGAASFVPKSYSSDRMLAVLREVLAGRVFYPDFRPESSVLAPGHFSVDGDIQPTTFGLSERKGEVLALMASGKSNREIAELLGLSEGTVKVHLTGIFKRLGVSSRTQAMVLISRHGVKF